MDSASSLTEYVRKADFSIASVLRLIPRSVYSAASTVHVGKTSRDALEGVSKRPKRKQKARVSHAENSERDSQVTKVASQDADRRKELRKKLHDKLASMRAARNADDSEAVQSGSQNRKEKKSLEKHSRKKEKSRRGQRGHEQKHSHSSKQVKLPANPPSDMTIQVGIATRPNDKGFADAPTDSLEVARLKGFAEDSTGTRRARISRAKTKSSKIVRLNQMLEKAAAEKDEVARMLQTDDDASKAAVSDARLDKAIQRASGAIVRDEPSKIRKSIRKERRKRKVKVDGNAPGKVRRGALNR